MDVEAYLEQGGVLTSPANAPPRYRGELMRWMASFVDSELAGAAGFADLINAAPGLKERIAAARIVLEKTDHAERVLDVMGDFGADVGRYAVHRPWASAVAARRRARARSGTAATCGCRCFTIPLQGWIDAVAFNVLMGEAVGVQFEEFARVSYTPLAEALRQIAPRERRHAELGGEGLRRSSKRRPAAPRRGRAWPIGGRASPKVLGSPARRGSRPCGASACAVGATKTCSPIGARASTRRSPNCNFFEDDADGER